MSYITVNGQYVSVNGQYITAPTPLVIKYGYLYNWYAATNVLLPNTGWTVPSLTNLSTLGTYLGDNSVAGNKLKESGLIYWQSVSSGTNTALFNARGAGNRWWYDGAFNEITHTIYLWSTTAYSGSLGYGAYIRHDEPNFAVGDAQKNNVGSSIRLLKLSTSLSNGQSGTYTGNDGQKYRTICIGTQEWLADNLSETKYNNGTDIPNITNGASWAATASGAYCAYNNDLTNVFL